jgi:Tfp pilus assembly protein PilP
LSGNEQTMRLLITVAAGMTLIAAPGMRAQNPQAAKNLANQAVAATGSRPASAGQAAPAKPAAAKSATVGKPAATKSGATAKPKSSTPSAKTVSEKRPVQSEQRIARRDPFESLVGRQQAQDALAKNLPPGKAGLQVGTLRLDGIVRAPNGMIAVVANPQQRTYFLREGDKLYDGTVEKISMEGVTFHEEGKDAFGKPVERQVSKRLYSTAGEQQ